jgi:hypothetical protein
MFESISFKGVDLLFSIFLAISLINTLNNVGRFESPCLTPLEMLKKTECFKVYYRNNQIQNVSEYPFLGITLKSNGNLSHISLQIWLK